MYALASVIGVLILIVTAFSIIFKGPRWYFKRNVRNSRPECMEDASLGSHGFLRTQDVRLHYVAAGSCSKPLMLFLHGFPECWYSWRYQLKEFKKDYRVVAVDMRGYCESEVLSGIHNYKMSKLVGDVKGVIEALGYSSCVLVAHDWGGLVAWTFAMDYPDLVDKLICMNVPHPDRFNEHYYDNIRQKFMSWYMLFFQVPVLPEMMISAGDYDFVKACYKNDQMGLRNKQNVTDDDVEAFKFAASQPGSSSAAINYYRALWRYPAEPRHNPVVTSPSLLIWGEEDKAFDKDILPGHNKFVKDLTLKKVSGASHFVQQDEPVIVNIIMREFLGSSE
ncbi:epoxide hydrolase 4-like isoform X1 [Amphiura filiformis]|uniref:epoxide hydrolase 4-like isoform X1 n=2 Tax=Amphiura filiformis TaxID=82378 RepID=UPI003B21B8DA